MIQTRLHILLGERRMNMMDLSRNSGVSYPQVQRIYHGQSTAISFDVLDAFCRTLKVGPADLLEYVEE